MGGVAVGRCLMCGRSDKPTGRLALVFELMDMNIYELIRGRKTYLPEAKVKNFMWMLLKVQTENAISVVCNFLRALCSCW